MIKKIVLVLTLIPTLAFSQAPKLLLERFTIEKGLSQNAVTCITQDSKGFLWIGTEDGLNRYDGYDFLVFKKELNNANSISENFISAICEDQDHFLWVGTSGAGVNKYDPQKNIFTKFAHDNANSESLSSDIVHCIFQDSKKRILIGTNNGVDLLNPKTGKIKRLKIDGHNTSINTIIEDNFNNLWIGSEMGLAKINVDQLEEASFKLFQHSSINENTLSHNSVLSIAIDQNGDMWIGTRDGLNKFLTKAERFIRYPYQPSNKNSISDKIIASIKEDSNGLLWLATYNGITILDKNNNQFYQYHSTAVDPHTLSDNLTQAVYEDNSGVIWVGTKFGGLTKFRKTKDFDNYLQGETVGPIIHSKLDLPNIVWVGTARNGLIKLDRKTNKIIAQYNSLTSSGRFQLPDNTINALYEAKNGDLWIVTWNSGLVQIKFKALSASQVGKVDREIDRMIRYYNEIGNPFSLHDNTIQVIFEDNQNRLWIGHSKGLDYYNRTDGKFYTFYNDPNNLNSLSDNSVQGCMLQDRNGELWLGTWNGLNRIVIKNQTGEINNSNLTFIKYFHQANDTNSLSDNKVISLWEDFNGTIWVGTYGGGLNQVIPNPKSKDNNDRYIFKTFTTSNGLPNNSIYGIKDDSKENIWISTNNGLSRYNIKSREFRNFEATDGLQSNQFFWRSSFKNHKGELFFGGINGLNTFYNDNITDSKTTPKIAVTSFKIFGREVEVGEDSPLKKEITTNSTIELSAKEKVFSFDFTGLHFYEPLKNKYAYKMEGFDDTWIQATSQRRFASYTNLDPGTYNFKIKASNSDGFWNEDGFSIKLIINPPWYSTWWFRTFIILIIGASVYYAINKRTEQLEKTQRKLEEKIKEATIEAEIRNAKLEEAKVKLANVMQEVKNQLGKTSLELVDAANSQATSIEEISASMQQMTKEINDSAKGVSEILNNARFIERDAQTGVSMSTKTVTSIQDIANAIEYISEFARLTKFLSLNASIEAAQAGANGRTFAVVAEQIRTLANQSKEVAVNITTVSESGLKLSEQTSEKISELLGFIQKIVVLISGITESSQTQSLEANHINIAIQQLATYVNSTTQLAEKLDAAIQSLSIEEEEEG